VLFQDEEDLGQTIDWACGCSTRSILGLPTPRPCARRREGVRARSSRNPVTGEIRSCPLIGAIDAIVVDEGKDRGSGAEVGKKSGARDQLSWDSQVTAYSMAATALGHDDAELKLDCNDEDQGAGRAGRASGSSSRRTSRSSRRRRSRFSRAVNAGVELTGSGDGLQGTCAHAGGVRGVTARDGRSGARLPSFLASPDPRGLKGRAGDRHARRLRKSMPGARGALEHGAV